MEMHRIYAAQFAITPEALEQERPAPTTQAYSNYLLRTALLG